MNSILLIDLGIKPYLEVLQLQEQLFNKKMEAKLNNDPSQNYLILCEHKPVFTLGKSGKRENILVTDEAMQAEFYHVNRGGDVTFHGPGQLVAYPILDLDVLHIGLARYVFMLEEVIIESLKPYDLQGERIENAAGIWLRGAAGDRKIAAMGIKASRNITMHGLAVNINTNLTFFEKILPCGIIGKGITSLQKELEKEVKMDEYKSGFVQSFRERFGLLDAAAQIG
jgi:lipoyl(octanoyl) transferase